MTNLYELEMTIITAMWSMEKIDMEQFDRGMFQDTGNTFDLIMKYRKDGNPAGDTVLSNNILGSSITKELIQALPKVLESTLSHYIRQLKITRYQQKLFKTLSESTLTPELLEEGVLAYKKTEKDGNLYDLSGDLKDYVSDLERRIRKDTPSYELGFKKLDEWISPLEPGMFLIIKALKKTGKTNFAMKIFCNMIKKDISSLYITSEMGYFKLIDKAIAITGNISASRLRKGNIEGLEKSKVTDTITTEIAGKKSFIYQSGMFDIENISELVTKTGAKIVFIDYVQMFRVSGDSSRAESLEKIACQIKDLAMTKGVVAIGMSQVNKEGDTKHCLSFEEKADQVISLKTKDDTDPTVKTLDVSVDYNRYGNTGMVTMVLKRLNCDIAELEQRYEEKIEKEDWRNK